MSAALRIREALAAIEQEKRVRILYACEAGSRAWGIESAESDYDVRFLYARPVEEYLRVEVPRDVIERPISDDLDVSGWDIFKALRLLRKSNPPLLEWLDSPVVYLERSAGIAALRALANTYYSTRAVFYHYRQMSAHNYKAYIRGREEVLTKKYLYVLRPLVMLLYLEQRQDLPPTSFVLALEQVRLPEEVARHLEELVQRKRAGVELGTGAPVPALNAFIEECLERWRDPLAEHEHGRMPVEELDQVLADILAGW